MARYVKKTIEQKLTQRTSVDQNTNCHVWTGHKDKDGYGRLVLQGKTWLAHRLSYFHRVGDIGTLQVLHSCDNPSCINPEHLRLGTVIDNMRDKQERNRVKGERHPRAKLTDEDILAIRASPLSQCQLARDLGLNQSFIGKIRNRVNWTHI